MKITAHIERKELAPRVYIDIIRTTVNPSTTIVGQLMYESFFDEGKQNSTSTWQPMIGEKNGGWILRTNNTLSHCTSIYPCS